MGPSNHSPKKPSPARPTPSAMFARRLLRTWYLVLVGLPISALAFYVLREWWNGDRTTFAGLLSCGFVGISLYIWVPTVRSAIMAAWITSRGHVTEAFIVAISSDKTVKVNGKHPKVFKYMFFVAGTKEKVRGLSTHLRASEITAKLWRVGDKLIVAYLPSRPDWSVVLSKSPTFRPPRRDPQAIQDERAAANARALDGEDDLLPPPGQLRNEPGQPMIYEFPPGDPDDPNQKEK